MLAAREDRGLHQIEERDGHEDRGAEHRHRARQSANASASDQMPRITRSEAHSVAASIVIGADASAAPIAMIASTIVARPSRRGITPVSAQILPIVHHHTPRTNSAGTMRSTFDEAA